MRWQQVQAQGDEQKKKEENIKIREAKERSRTLKISDLGRTLECECARG